jgi:transcriptional regulator with XRE-family HTH domain
MWYYIAASFGKACSIRVAIRRLWSGLICRTAIVRHAMIISDRLRSIREEKNLSQSEIEKRTGLKRCYISRVENGHTVPSIETLEKLARAMEIPLYQIFYDGEDPPVPPPLPPSRESSTDTWGIAGDSARFLLRLRHLLGRISDRDRRLLLHLASQLVRRTKP